jgi:hypothetical protein
MTDDELEARLNRIERAVTEVALSLHPQLSPTNPLAGSTHANARVAAGSPSLYAIAREQMATAKEARS